MGYFKTDLFRISHPCPQKHCPYGQYLCYRDNFCILIENICDGINHCPLGDDESGCGWIINFFLFYFFEFLFNCNLLFNFV